MANIGLFFGTFDPIHVGHLIIANQMAIQTSIDQVWLVVTPQNPFKQDNRLLADHHRLALAKIAVEDNDLLHVSDVEFKMPKPSYTIDTIVYLQEKYPQHTFSLIMGEDNLASLHKWKNHEQLVDRCQILVYPRMHDKKGDYPYANHTKISRVEFPLMQVSSSYIRKAIGQGKDVRYLLTEPVRRYVEEMNFYKS